MPRTFPHGPCDWASSGDGPRPCAFIRAICIFCDMFHKNKSNVSGTAVFVVVIGFRTGLRQFMSWFGRRVTSRSRQRFTALVRSNPFRRLSMGRNCRQPPIKTGPGSCALLARPFVQLTAYAERRGSRISGERYSNSRITHHCDGGLLLRRS